MRCCSPLRPSTKLYLLLVLVWPSMMITFLIYFTTTMEPRGSNSIFNNFGDNDTQDINSYLRFERGPNTTDAPTPDDTQYLNTLVKSSFTRLPTNWKKKNTYPWFERGLNNSIANQAKPPDLRLLTVKRVDNVHDVRILKFTVINPHRFGFVYNQPYACHNQTVDILFVVPSAPGNSIKRHTIRKSALYQYAMNRTNNARLLFFLGYPERNEKKKIQYTINNEALLHQDIVQQNFTDVYRNIRLKAVSMLKWSSTYCYNANYVIRTDDDVGIDVEKLVKTIHKVGKTHDNFILGQVCSKWPVHRDKNSKYYVPESEYAQRYWPTFALGGLLGYPIMTVRLLYEAALRVKAVWLDDVYITGICGKVINATLLAEPGFVFKH